MQHVLSVSMQLQVVVQVELHRMGNGADAAALLTLGGNQLLQQLLREDTAHSQVVMVSLQSIQSLLQAGGQTGELCLLYVAPPGQAPVDY